MTPEANFADDLDADSLDLVELVMALEEQFDITVDESELEGVSTVGQAFDLVSLQALMLAVHPSPDGREGIQGRRVVVTGIGVVGALRHRPRRLLGRPARPGARRAAAGRATTSTPPPLYGPKEVRRVDRFTQFAAVAAEEAIARRRRRSTARRPRRRPRPDRSDDRHRGRRPRDPRGADHTSAGTRGARRVSPFLVPMMMGNRAAADVSMRYGFRGPCETTVTACAAGTHSVANGARLVATGRCDVVVAGSAEAAMTETEHGRLLQHDRPVDAAASRCRSTSNGTASSWARAGRC